MEQKNRTKGSKRKGGTKTGNIMTDWTVNRRTGNWTTGNTRTGTRRIRNRRAGKGQGKDREREWTGNMRNIFCTYCTKYHMYIVQTINIATELEMTE